MDASLPRYVALVVLLIIAASAQIDTDGSPPISAGTAPPGNDPQSPPGSTLDAFLTSNKCDGWLASVPVGGTVRDASTLPDCGCPPGYTAVLVEWNRGAGSNSTLCAALWSPRPSHEGCIAAGTATDYYDLPLAERRWVRDLLVGWGVSEFWISARLLTAQGPLVRRLPGPRWNSPLDATLDHDQHLELDLNAPNSASGGFRCAAVGGAPDYGRLFLTDCSRALPLLCLVRIPPALLQLNCRKGELTTRYRDHSAEQQQCYTVVPVKGRDRHRYPLSGYRIFVVDSARKVHLLRALLEQAAKSRKDCQKPYYIDATKGEVPSGGGSLLADGLQVPMKSGEKPPDCLVVQRDAGATDEQQGGTMVPPAMHLYFDRERHKLLLTVYGQRWFWREKQSSDGFTCYTDAGSELINPVRVRTVRRYGKASGRGRRANPRGNPHEGTAASDGDSAETEQAPNAERTLYELVLVDGQPGQYWCEAHLLPNFTHLVTPATLAYRKLAEGRSFFAIMLDAWLPANSSSSSSGALEAMRPKDYRVLVKDALKRHRHLAKVKDVYGALKGMQVRQAIPLRTGSNQTSSSSSSSRRQPVRLVLHLAMARIDDWPGHFTGAWEYEENAIALPEQYLTIYRMRQCLGEVFEMVCNSSSSSSSSNDTWFRLLGVNSTEYCLPDRLSVSPSAEANGNVWWAARLGETIAPQNLCVVERNGLPPTRRCLGDYLHGCAWDRPGTGWPQQPDRCAPIQQTTTGALYRYSAAPLNDTPTLRSALGTVEQVLSRPATLIPADLFYIAKTLEKARDVLVPVNRAGNGDQDPGSLLSDPELYCNLTAIMSRIMYVNETVVTVSQRALNTTNMLLYATETIVNQVPVATVAVEGSDAPAKRYECDRGDALEETGGAGLMADGTVVFRSARLIVLIADPAVANVSGVALFRPVWTGDPDQTDDDVEDDFTRYTLRFLYVNQSQEALLKEEGLEIGAFIPQSVLDGLATLYSAMQLQTSEQEQEEPAPERLEEESEEEEEKEVPTSTAAAVEAAPSPPPPVRIVIAIYYNDRAFRETRNGTIARPNAKIISVSVPGYGSRMPDEIPIFTREYRSVRNGTADDRGRCGYWSFAEAPAVAAAASSTDADQFGRWAYDECRLLGESGRRKLCGCYHLTSFSRLTMDTQLVESVGVSQKLIADQGTYALDVITAIGCSLSLLGVLGIVATAVLFPSWRVKASSKILLQLSGAIAIEMIILFVEGPDIDLRRISRIECALLGSTLHYIILVTFLWMLVTAYLQFQRYVKVVGRLRPAHFILKATALCWGLPLVPVVTFLATDYALYLKRDNLSDICYPHGAALWYGLLLPIATIVLLNLVSFIVVLYHICTIRDPRHPNPNNRTGKTVTGPQDHDLTLAQLRLSVFLFFLLGLPWIFGMLTTGTEEKLFAYLFCLTAPVQGFVLFLYFVVMDPVARRLWLVRLRRCTAVATGRTASTKDTDMEKETTGTTPSTTLNTQL
uniref:Putative g protein-coupled receptor n=1 Tax=Anopheles marajoara TaxID=58244 RepID=A0A2M4B957_9DIPT